MIVAGTFSRRWVVRVAVTMMSLAVTAWLSTICGVLAPSTAAGALGAGGAPGGGVVSCAKAAECQASEPTMADATRSW